MPRAAPSFPAFDEWQKMSEGEQDALLEAVEAAQRRGPLLMRLLIALAGVGVAAAGVGALLVLA
jgi:hypothetical protein